MNSGLSQTVDHNLLIFPSWESGNNLETDQGNNLALLPEFPWLKIGTAKLTLAMIQKVQSAMEVHVVGFLH